MVPGGSADPIVAETPTRAAGPTAAPARFYRPELDGLRFVAFFMVFVHHAVPKEPSAALVAHLGSAAAAFVTAAGRSGALGVDLFFVLSSYLITELLLREQDRRGNVDVKAFYVRRLLRIWPLYYAFLLLAGFVFPHVGLGRTMADPALAAFALFAGNWYVARAGYPTAAVGPLWSVSLEEQFYLCWPLVVRFAGRRRIKSIAVGMIVCSLAFRIALNLGHVVNLGVATWTMTFGRLEPIGAGVLVALFRHEHPLFELSPRARRWLALAGAACIVSVELLFSIENATLGLAVFGYPLATAGAVLLLFAAQRSSAVPARPTGLAHPALVYLGKISYGLYVFHVMALGLVRHAPARLHLGGAWTAPVGFVLTLAIAAASYRFLERPFLRLKERFTYVPSRAT
jgi:peptidoglycan/LPS O-acetylase OafA/YrhL